MTPRDATPADIAEIVRVTNAAYRVEDFFIDGDRTTAAEVTAKLAAPGAGFLVIDAPQGGLAASVYVELRGDRGYFGMLSVDPACQKQGFSRALIEAVAARFRAAGSVALVIDVVNLREELPAFYAKLGFTPEGTAPFANPRATRPAHLIVMTKAL